MANWLLIGPAGKREQVCTTGDRTPTEDGANPRRWREVPVDEHHDDLEAATFDEVARSWSIDPAKKEHRRQRHARIWIEQMPPGVFDAIVEAVIDKLGARREK